MRVYANHESWRSRRDLPLIALGGLLLAISPFIAWVHVFIAGDYSLLGLLAVSRVPSALALLMSAAGVGIALAALLADNVARVRLASLVIGIVAGVFGGLYAYGLFQAVHGYAGFVDLRPGVFVALLGVVLLIVPVVVGRRQARAAGASNLGPRRRFPAWGFAAAGLALALGLAFIPYSAGQNNYCGAPTLAAFKSNIRIPVYNPPPPDSQLLGQDQTAVAQAQQAVNQQQQADQNALNEQQGAQSLAQEAAQAQSDAGTAAAQVGTDQATVSSDQAGVQSDQQMVQNDQNTIQTDQSNGWDTSGDQQILSSDQATLAQQQTTVQQDQAALAKDQQAAAALASTAQQLQSKANAAQNKASVDSQSSANGDSASQQALDQAQQQLESDQQAQQDQSQAYEDTYNQQLTNVKAHNAALASCQTQGTDRLASAAWLFGLALLTALVVGLRRRSRKALVPRA